ncbi:MAG: Mur ligase family protein [Candidatus Omnitrophica bacterium]|nr:Mur ligase family protein [Candidatus Omnitrophota bacterium]
MINTEHFKNKKVVVVGLARSGLACANLLYDRGAQVSVTDNSDNDSTRVSALKLKSKDIKLELGRHTREFIKGNELMVISPGLSDDSQPVIWARSLGIPVVSEIEVAWSLCPAKVIAVTGSCGKTTVATLIGRMLEAAGKKAWVCGNIGNPFSAQIEKIRERDFISLEVSSFQLEKIDKFRPQIAVILNFSANHLDRYKSLGDYLEAKKRIFMNQKEGDFLVLNALQAEFKEWPKETKAQIKYFSGNPENNPNLAALLVIASILGISQDVVHKVVGEFKGIQHRLEQVAEINNVVFINDSKATTADSTLWALKNLQRPIVLIVGGRDKGVDYSMILGLAREKVREVILLGEAKEKIRSAFKGSLSMEEADTLPEAVQRGYALARPGDCVLLSPMCSSFDMFADYEERGECFKKAVYALEGRKS